MSQCVGENKNAFWRSSHGTAALKQSGRFYDTHAGTTNGTQGRQVETGQKIIVGGVLLAAARHHPKIHAWVIKEATKP